MAEYTYTANVDTRDHTTQVLLRQGQLRLDLGTWADLTDAEVAQLAPRFVLTPGRLGQQAGASQKIGLQLSELSDVNLANLQDGYVLGWSTSTNTWVPVANPNPIKVGFGPPTGANLVGLYTNQVNSSVAATNWIRYWDGQVVGTGASQTNQLLKRPVYGVGTGSYIFRDNESTALITMAPGSGLRSTFRLAHSNIEFVDAGNWADVLNLGPGSVDIVADAGVTLYPAGTWTAAPGYRVQVICVALNVFVISGATLSQTATAPVNQTAPVNTYNAGTFTASSLGAWVPSAGTTYAIQWTRDGANIGGATSSTYTYVSGTDAGHVIAFKVTATNNAVSSAPVSSNGITNQPSGASAFATGWPRLVMSVAQTGYPVGTVVSAVEVGWTVEVDYGTIAGSPAPTTKTSDWKNVDNSSPAVVTSRGTDSLPGPWQYTTIAGDSGPGGNEHIYASVTIGNGTGTPVTVDTPWVVVVPTGTLTGSGGGTGSGRDATLQPFGVSSPFNLALGSSANLAPGDARSTTIHGGTMYINSQYYSIPVLIARSTDATCTVTTKDAGVQTFKIPAFVQIANGTDGNMTVIDENHTLVREMWKVIKTGTNTYTCDSYTSNTIDERGWGCGPINTYHPSGIRASQFSVLGGLIRQWESAAGVINHPLVMAINQTRTAHGPVFPATREDSSSGGYAGNIPLGTMFALDPAWDFSSLSAGGKILATCLRDYGAYVGDTTNGNTVFCAEPGMEGSTVLSQMRSDMTSIMQHMSVVTNSQSINTIGGGGSTRRQPDRATIGTPAAATNPVIDIDKTFASFASTGGSGWGHTVSPGGVNPIVMAAFKTTNNATVSTGAPPTFAGLTMTRLGGVSSPNSTGTGKNVELWYLLNPPAGNFNLIFTLNATGTCGIDIVSFSNVLQSSPFRTPVYDSGAVKSALSMTTASGGLTSDVVLAFACGRSTGTSMTVGSGQTEQVEALAGTNTLCDFTTKPGSTAAVANTFTFTPVTGGGDEAAGMAVALKLG